jgi:hypothetical protein
MHGRVRSFPFVGEVQQEPFKELHCFASNQAIHGDDKSREVSVLFKTGSQVLLLFLTLLLGQDLLTVT